jgi:cytochrome c oxidase subunit 2
MHRFWGLLFGVVLLAALVLTAVAPYVGWWLPLAASSYAPEIDHLFYLIMAIVTFFYVLTEVLLVFNMMRFGTEGRRAQFTHGNQKLEIIWSIVPAVILILIAVLQVKAWANIKYPSHLADHIEHGEKYQQLGVEARQWEFRIRYPSPAHMAEWDQDPKNAATDFKGRLPERVDDVWLPNDVHVWKGQKVLIYFKTRDVGHSLFFPNLRLKQDALPGRTIPVWFEATESNTMSNEVDGKKFWHDGWRMDGSDKWTPDKNYIFDLVCTQYCGTRHSLMRGKLYVHPTKEDFMAWLEHAKDTVFDKKAASGRAVSATP